MTIEKDRSRAAKAGIGLRYMPLALPPTAVFGMIAALTGVRS